MIELREILTQIQPYVLGWTSRMPTATAAISSPPTAAEVAAAFGTVGMGFRGLLQDLAQANTYLCVFDGTSWWYQVLTKAV